MAFNIPSLGEPSTLGSQDIQANVAGLLSNPAALASMASYMMNQLPPAPSSQVDSSSSASASQLGKSRIHSASFQLYFKRCTSLHDCEL